MPFILECIQSNAIICNFFFLFPLISRCTSCLFPMRSGLQFKEPTHFEEPQTLIYSSSAQSLSSKEADETAKERKNCSEGIRRLTLLLLRQGEASFLLFVFLTLSMCHVIANFIIHNALRACSIVIRVIGIMQVSVCSGSHSHSGIPGLPSWLFCPQEQISWKVLQNIVCLFQNISMCGPKM